MYTPLFIKENASLDAIIESVYDSLTFYSIVASIYYSAQDFEADEYGNAISKRDDNDDFFGDDYEEFENHWDRCMDRNSCKIGVIVGICFGGVLILWLLSVLLMIFCCGFKFIEVLCCCRPGGCLRSRYYARGAPFPAPLPGPLPAPPLGPIPAHSPFEKVHDYPMTYNRQQQYYT